MDEADGTLTSRLEEMSLKDALLQQLECPVCFSTMTSPIFMCCNGHNVCSRCRDKVAECPVCRAPGSPPNRNLAFEALCSQASVTCANCAMQVRARYIDKHNLEECDFRFKCLCENCPWLGPRTTLREHVAANHPDFYRTNQSPRIYKWCFAPQKSLGVLIFVPWDGELFWVRLRYSSSTAEMYLYAQCVGDATTAANYRCEFALASTDKRFTATYSGPTLGHGEDHASRRRAVKLDVYMLKLLAQNGDEFEYSFKILKYDKSSRPLST